MPIEQREREIKMKATTLAEVEREFRPMLTRLPPKIAVAIYSRGRSYFLEKLAEEVPTEVYSPPRSWARTLWGIEFRSPIMNSAGMFKNGGCYEMVARQGAGAYLGGTGTWNARTGNEKLGIHLPFAPYPRSHSASNWMGLPNDGDEVNSQRVRQMLKVKGVPICWSVMGSPDLQGEEKLKSLVCGMLAYEKAEVDLIEVNESCPNTSHGKPQDNDLYKRLKYLKEHFLDRRAKNLPVIVKFSNDTQIAKLPEILDMLCRLGYDGVNFGNTSTAYERVRAKIDAREQKLFDFFSQTFGGGVSGRPLRESSLELASNAVRWIKAGPPAQEFHVIRTGGIESLRDVQDSERAGVSLNQWFTGYFENFARHGHFVYKFLFEGKG